MHFTPFVCTTPQVNTHEQRSLALFYSKCQDTGLFTAMYIAMTEMTLSWSLAECPTWKYVKHKVNFGV